MGRIIITKKSPERNEAGSGQGQGIKKSPGMLASIRTVLQVFRKELRKGSSRFWNLGSDWQLTAGQLNYLGCFCKIPNVWEFNVLKGDCAFGGTVWQ